MVRKLRPKRRITHSDSLGKCQARELTAQSMLDETLTRLVPGVTLPRPKGALCGLRDLFSVLLYAAAHQITIE